MLKFGRNESSKSYKKLRDKIKEFNLNIDHFLTPSQTIKLNFINGVLIKKENNIIFTKDSVIGRSTVKKRIISENLIEYKCKFCQNDGNWLDKKFSLILDHENGVPNDNRIENLRFLCPNCNATLNTHCVGKKAFIKKEKKIDKRTIRNDRLEIRKVKWPTKEELTKLLFETSYSAIGRKYGVSDNAVRKWFKKYNMPM